MRIYIRFIIVVAFTSLTFCSTSDENVLRIAVASNMQFVVEDWLREFEENTTVPCQIIMGSSGKLASQIIEGAPYDILISADTVYPHMVYRNLSLIQPPKVYAYGKLVLGSPTHPHLTLQSLTNSDVHKIAIANPEVAPYGKLSLACLQKLELLDSLKTKLVYGENVTQVNQFLETKAVEVGITCQSAKYNTVSGGKSLYWVAVPDSLYEPIPQSYLLLVDEFSKKRPLVLQFENYLNSSKARAILKKYDYLLPR